MAEEQSGGVVDTSTPDIGSTRAAPGTGVDTPQLAEGTIVDALGTPDLEATPGTSVYTEAEKTAAEEKAAHGDVDAFKTFRGEDGVLNEEQASKAYQELRTKLSQGKTGETPEKADGYTFDFGDAEVDDAQATAFKEEAFKAGFSQDQYEMVMGKYMEQMNSLTESLAGPTAENAQETLTKEWGKDFEGNMKSAAKAWTAFGSGDVDAIGNNVEVLQLLASIGTQLGEDDFNSQNMNTHTPSNMLSADELTDLRNREDYYTNPEVQARVLNHYKQQFGET